LASAGRLPPFFLSGVRGSFIADSFSDLLVLRGGYLAPAPSECKARTGKGLRLNPAPGIFANQTVQLCVGKSDNHSVRPRKRLRLPANLSIH
jgi:hypothetical protein